MLILTRKPEESIMIGDDVEIKVLGVQENQVRLGITAPKHIGVHRKEIYLTIQQENSEAAITSDVTGLADLLQPRPE